MMILLHTDRVSIVLCAHCVIQGLKATVLAERCCSIRKSHSSTAMFAFFEYRPIWQGYLERSDLPTMVGVLICIVTTIPAAYALSRDDLFGVKVLNLLFTFTMFFSGGIIPMFILLRTIKIYNSIWAIVFPSAVSVFNLIVCKTFFMTNIPRIAYCRCGRLFRFPLFQQIG